MNNKDRKSFAVAKILNAANKYYDEGYLSRYFNEKTGRPKARSGDTLAKFIVAELFQTFDDNVELREQVAEAVRVLDRSRDDIQNAINGLLELQAK